MTKFSFLYLFTFALIFSGMVFVTKIEGKDCMRSLFQGECYETKCQHECQGFFPDGKGTCAYNSKFGDDECICHWNC
ncbi:Defensin-like protein 161 [Linum perenne]